MKLLYGWLNQQLNMNMQSYQFTNFTGIHDSMISTFMMSGTTDKQCFFNL